MIATSNPRVPRTGLTLVECELVLSMTLMLLLGILEYGRFLMTRQVLESAAREGARYAVVNTYLKATTDVQDVTDNALAGEHRQLEGYSKATSIQVYLSNTSGNPANTGAWNSAANDWKNAQFGEPIAVRITGNYRPVLPSFLYMTVNSNGTIPLQVTAVMYSEAN
jgi:Flp pilus assembly protein TadG